MNVSKIKLQHNVGWVTLAKNGEALVTKQSGRLPAHMRQIQRQQWTRRVAIDSARERGRALERDRASEDEKMKLAKGGTREPLHSRPPVTASAYRREIDTDPSGIGFAYGGIYPGRLHAKGRLIERHEVHFSLAKCGDYRLYVSLHGRGADCNAHVPGSPFTLHVAPGRAHPLTTQIPASELPLRATSEVAKDKEKDVPSFAAQELLCVCELKLQARDKMGNPCSTGGANVSCGFLELPRSEQPEHDCEALAKQEGTSVDVGDGTYSLKWTTPLPGTFHVYVKIDGLHVLGSPARLVAPTPSFAPAPAPDASPLAVVPVKSVRRGAGTAAAPMARRNSTESLGSAAAAAPAEANAPVVHAAPAPAPNRTGAAAMTESLASPG